MNRPGLQLPPQLERLQHHHPRLLQCFQPRLATHGNHIFTPIILVKIVMLFVLTFMHVAQQITTEIFTQGS